MRAYWLALGVLAVWRVTHLLHAEDGPWQLFVRVRRRAGDGFWGTVLDCFQCLSLWISAPIAMWLGETWSERALLWPALSGGAILAERLIVARQTPPAQYFEESEDDNAPGAPAAPSAPGAIGAVHDVMLRQSPAKRDDEAGVDRRVRQAIDDDEPGRETGGHAPRQRVL